MENVTAAFATSPERARLLGQFRSSDPAVREEAISVAARYLEPQVLGPLLAESAEANVRNAALDALVRQGPYARDYLRELAEGEDPEVAMFCVQALSRLPDPNCAPILVMLLGHDDVNVALAAIEALGLLRSETAVPALLEIVGREDDLWRRCAAVRALGQIGDARALPAVLDLTRDDFLREPAIESLGGFDRPDAAGALLDLLVAASGSAARDMTLKALGRSLDLLVEADEDAARKVVASWQPDEQLVRYLEDALRMPDVDLARAAGSAVVLRRLQPVFALVARRASNAEELGWIRDLFRRHAAHVRPALRDLLCDEDPRVRAGTAEVAAFDDELAPVMLDLMDDADEKVRHAAFRAAGRNRFTAAVPALLEGLASDNEHERDTAVEALAGMPAEALADVQPLLDPAGPKHRVLAALRVARAVPCERWKQPLLAGCASEDADVRLAAVKAAGAIEGPELQQELRALLDDPVEAVRAEVAEILIRHEAPDTVEALMDLLDREDLTRYHAIRGLGRLRASDSAERLRSIYPDAALHEKLGIISALTRVRPPWIVEFLGRSYEESDGDVRRAAAEGLAKFAESPNLGRLLDMAGDEDWSIRAFSARALGELGSNVARSALLNLARDVEPLVAQTAREVLGDGD